LCYLMTSRDRYYTFTYSFGPGSEDSDQKHIFFMEVPDFKSEDEGEEVKRKAPSKPIKYNLGALQVVT